MEAGRTVFVGLEGLCGWREDCGAMGRVGANFDVEIRFCSCFTCHFGNDISVLELLISLWL